MCFTMYNLIHVQVEYVTLLLEICPKLKSA